MEVHMTNHSDETLCYDRNGVGVKRGDRVQCIFASGEELMGTAAYDFFDEDDNNSPWLLVDINNGQSIGLAISSDNVCTEVQIIT
jgi:hypothetical protein